MAELRVLRQPLTIGPTQSRVLIRPFVPADERITRIIARVMALPEEQVSELLDRVNSEFADRHLNIRAIFAKHYNHVKRGLVTDQRISENRQLLIGSYFTHEYSLESAALFNPSIVLHPDQSNLEDGSVRFVLSLRATGEGHISSIVFRQGIIDAHGAISLVEPSRFVTEPDHVPCEFDKEMFTRKLREVGLDNDCTRLVLEHLGGSFTREQLEGRLAAVRRESPRTSDLESTLHGMRHLELSNYSVSFRAGPRVSERAIFPASPSQSNGIEDARFVLFRDDDGSATYYATYTAYDGRIILPQLLETRDFVDFRFITLNGPAVRNKGMALFPRRINGHYAMLSRQDGENIYLMYSDNIHFWYSTELILRPTYSWEFYQMGNCGSPIETDEGWLVLSHGVGAMRKYSIGAFLLDKEDPSKVIGRLSRPLLEPTGDEREGYVPNVVYTCGAMVHADKLVVPYAVSDSATRFAEVPLADVLSAME